MQTLFRCTNYKRAYHIDALLIMLIYTFKGKPMDQQQIDRFYQELGGRIRNYREPKGLSQEALGRAVGLTRTSISNIEKGRQRVLAHSLLDIANVLGVEVMQLFPEKAKSRPVSEKAIQILAGLPDKERIFIERAIGITEEGT